MQDNPEHFALHFLTANGSFLHILHRINKPFSVFFELVSAYSCHIQHFFLVSWFQNAHMNESFVGKYHIWRNFFFPGNLQAERTEPLKKRLVLFSKFPCASL